MKAQIEQKCNAHVLKKMGVTVIDEFSEKKIAKIKKWINKPALVNLKFNDQSQSIVDRILMDYIKSNFLINQL